MNIPNVESNPLINNEEHKKDDFTFIENIFQKPSVFLKDAKKKICNWKICTKIPLSLCFFMIASLFLVILLGSFLITALLLMKSLYKEINDLYFTNFVIDPIINKKTNKTQVFNIRNEILDDIYLESKLTNMQIALEFINDNYNQSINIMRNHNSFNPIMVGINQILNGRKLENEERKEETEKDYFMYEYGIVPNSIFSNYTYNLISSMTHYLKLFESNLDFDIFGKEYVSIKQMFIYIQDIDNFNRILLTYCKNWDNENGLLESIFSNYDILGVIIREINLKRYNYSSHINKTEYDSSDFNKYFNQSVDFAEYITRNDFQDKINQLNLLKFKTFNITFNNKIYVFLLGIRLDTDSMINLFNKQNSNMTTILPVTDLTMERNNLSYHELHLLYDNKYFTNFFEYGIKNILYSISLKINSQFSDEVDYQNTNIKTFFEVLYYYERILYNENWKREFIIITQLIKKIVGDKDFPELQCNEDEIDYNNENIMCEINKNLIVSESDIIFGDIPNKNTTDPIFYDLNETAFFLHRKIHLMGRCEIFYILMQNVFTDLEQKKSNVKIYYYNRTVNNLEYYNIEVLNFTTYNSVKEDFIKEMDEIEYIVTIVRIIFSIIFLFTSLIKIIREVFNAIKRINAIISLKDMLFNKTELKYDEDKDLDNDDLLNDKLKLDSQGSSLSEKEDKEEILNGQEDDNEDGDDSSSDDEDKKLLYDNMFELEKKKDKAREKWSKNHVYENNFFPEGNKIIIKYTYNRLKSIFENMDNYQSEKFAEKLVFLKRRYKLNEQNEDKEDCELSSDIYQAISKISIINMDDIFYNVYYNQSYALNQSFKMFKSILDSSINKQSIPQRNNKFINFGRILKIIYHFKKEKIQKIVEIIYDKDLKYKQQVIKKKENSQDIIIQNNEALNEIINLTRNNSGAHSKKKNGYRKSFIQGEK